MQIIDHLLAVWRGEGSMYESMRTSNALTGEALLIAVIIGAATRVPAAIHLLGNGAPAPAIQALITGVVVALLAWFAMASVIFAIATWFFPSRTRWRAVLLALPYASTPLLI
ncbi:MAG: hypothetical protein JOY55_25155, partial [Mycobacterium sp.]|nr:hypothetical protein [Mycobacterium sp.]